ncbi:MAG: hypothetical protein EOO45_18790, partial [Flavobacterium sp.]
MTIYINCTIEDLEAKTVKLQDALNHENIDRRYWLEALIPGGKGSDPYEGLPKEDYNVKFNEWMDAYDEYAKPRRKMLEQILDGLLNDNDDRLAYNQLKPFLTDYMNNDTGPIQYKSALILEKYDLNEIVLSMLPVAEDATSKVIYNTFYVLNRFAYNQELSAFAAQLIADAMRTALPKTYDYSNPYFNIFNLVRKISAQHPEIISQPQEELVEALNVEKLDYRGYGSALFMMKEAWAQMKPYWRENTINTLVENLIEVVDVELSPGDAFVEDDVLPALKVIGEGHAGAQAAIKHAEKELEEYYA